MQTNELAHTRIDVVRPTVRVRLEALTALRAAANLSNGAKFAEHIGMAESTTYRITTGRTQPSTGFIASSLLALNVPFDALFEVAR